MTIQARRHSPRFALYETEYVNLGSGTRGLILDVSEGGLRFKTAAPFTEPPQIRFWLGSSRDLEGEGSLAWTDESRTVGGLRFKAVPREMRRQLRAWIENAEAEPLAHRSQRAQLEVEKTLAATGSAANSAPSAAEVSSAMETARETSVLDTFAGSHAAFAGILAPEPPLETISDEALRASVALETPAESLLSPRPNLIAKESSLSMFPAETTEAYQRASHQRRHRVAVSVLVLLILLGAAASAAAYHYPVQTRHIMGVAQAKLEQFINPAHKQPLSGVEPASMGVALEPSNSFPQAARSASNDSPAKPESGASASTPGIAGHGSANGSNAAASPAAGTNPAGDAATVKNNSEADLQLAQQYLAGDKPEEIQKAIQLLWLATEKGNVDAEIFLADLYTRGENVPKNCVQARILLKAAAESDPTEAKSKLSELDRSGCS